MTVATTINVLRLVIPGEAVGKGRPRFNSRQGRTYTPAKTERAERDVKAIWREAGSPRLPDDAALVAHVGIYVERPASHYRKGGEMSADGLRNPFPRKKPDIDNALKLILDSLNGLAYRDDAQVVEVHARRLWARTGEVGATTVTIMVKIEDMWARA